MMEKLESFLNRFIAPVAQRLSESDAIQSVAEGFMRTGPITFGVFLFAIIGNLPIASLTTFLSVTGLKASIDAVFNAGLNILALYVSFTIAYAYARRKDDNAVSAGLLSLMSFLIIVPQSIAAVDGTITAFNISYLGGNGILAALVISLAVSRLFHCLSNRGFTFKMPPGVPPMVSESLEPMFISMFIACFAFVFRAGFSFTPFGNFIDFFQQVIGSVLTRFACTVPFVIIIVLLANVLWFFGIHPNTLYSPFMPITLILITTNMADFEAGRPLTYLSPALAFYFAGLGGNGSTLGLCIAMFTAKSKRYQKMLKISLVPNIFNINEPLIFGLPVMLNPIFFFPMTLSCLAMAGVGLGLSSIFPFLYNPSVGLLPFAVPFFMHTLIGGGIAMLLISCCCILVSALIYLPFFRIVDRKACEAEMRDIGAAQPAEREKVLFHE